MHLAALTKLPGGKFAKSSADPIVPVPGVRDGNATHFHAILNGRTTVGSNARILAGPKGSALDKPIAFQGYF